VVQELDIRSGFTTTSPASGTSAFMAAELHDEDPIWTPATDVYAFAGTCLQVGIPLLEFHCFLPLTYKFGVASQRYCATNLPSCAKKGTSSCGSARARSPPDPRPSATTGSGVYWIGAGSLSPKGARRCRKSRNT
jgi:hypothetical protein